MKQNINDYFFNGYVKEPIPMVILASVVGIALLFFSIWSSIDLCIPSDNQTTTQIAYFVEYEPDGPVFSLLASDGNSYNLPIKVIDDTSMIDHYIESKISLCIEYVSISGDSAISRDIASITTLEGIPIISSDIITEARSTNAKTSSITMWVACLLYWFILSASYYCISNAPQFSRIASLLVRKPFRNF